MTDKQDDKKNDESHQEATVAEKQDTGSNFAMEVQSERVADDSTPKNDSSATKRSYGEISQDEMKTTE